MTTSSVTSTSVLEGSRLPPFRLPRAGGGWLAASDYRARHNLVIAVLPDAGDPATAAALLAIQPHQARLAQDHARAVAIVGGSLSAATALHTRLDLAFPVAADETGAIIDRLAPTAVGGREPVVLLTDRYGEIRRREVGWPALTAVGVVAWLDWLVYIDCLCSC
jgi:peroxiredoxin